MTRELTKDLSAAEATAVTEEIRNAYVRTFDAITDVNEAIARAYQGRAFTVLGYSDWESYCAAEFAVTRLWVTAEDRQARTKAFLDAGLSQRSIAAVLSVGTATTVRDVKVISGPDGPLITEVTGSDGTTRPRTTGSKPVTEDLVKRRLEVARLADQGLSQEQIAVRVGVSQPTVSTDLREMQILGERSPEQMQQVVQSEEMTYQDLMSQFELVTLPKADLGRLATNVLRDLELQTQSLYESVVMDDEWIVPAQRQAAVRAMVPKIGDVLVVLASALAEIKAEDLPDEPQELRRWSQTMSQVQQLLAKVVTQ